MAYCRRCETSDHWTRDCTKVVTNTVANKPNSVRNTPKVANKVTNTGQQVTNAIRETKQQRWRRVHADEYRAKQRELMRVRRANGRAEDNPR